MNNHKIDADATLVSQGDLPFSIESRIIRELGERLVKQGETALIELIKNSYDAEASYCKVYLDYPDAIKIEDDGHGMTIEDFTNAWMRIGTSSKEKSSLSKNGSRNITGEKGIGRFAVRFLGRKLTLRSVAFDKKRGKYTLLVAKFDWQQFDKNEDLGSVIVPYKLYVVDETYSQGTELTIEKLRKPSENINLKAVRTASMSVLSPHYSLLKSAGGEDDEKNNDSGFVLKIASSLETSVDIDESADVANEVLEAYAVRAVLSLKKNRVSLTVFTKGVKRPIVDINDYVQNKAGEIYADIRFFPQRAGAFTGMSIDGRRAKSWVKDNSGVCVFDKNFRVAPYGSNGDDWLMLSSDKARSARTPRSTLAQKHFPMSDEVRKSTQLNYMLGLPYPEQLIGIIKVSGKRIQDINEIDEDVGLIAAADREGFILNDGFTQLFDLVRGTVEAIASVDKDIQLENEKLQQLELVEYLREETQQAIDEITANKDIPMSAKRQIIKYLTETQSMAQYHDEISRQRETSLEVMSLLGVVAGFMTHEFGTAIHDLELARLRIDELAKLDPKFREDSNTISMHIKKLTDYVNYSQAYIKGASGTPDKPFKVRPRIQQVIRVFGKYAEDRLINVHLEIDNELMAPLVPLSLYSGIALNLFTNALKAITAKIDSGDRKIAFRSWSEKGQHILEVSDTGIGIPTALKERVFDPLYTTTATNNDPLGSGMGLGLALVRRGAAAFRGSVTVVSPPPGYITCFRLTLPLE